MRNAITYFLTALMYFTRIPVRRSIGHSDSQLTRAAPYFPLVGWLVGGLVGAVLVVCHTVCVFPYGVAVAVLFSMVAGAMITGAFHEDGLADSCDGFGGGYSKAQVLEIMKDSRLGTFGALGLIFVVLVKFTLLLSLVESIVHRHTIQTLFGQDPRLVITLVLIAAHALSRAAAALYIPFLPYVRDESGSKSKPIAEGQLSGGEMLLTALFGLLPLCVFIDLRILLLLLPIGGLWMLGRTWLKKRLGGYTGDCLGAAQQIFEVVIYVGILVVWEHDWAL